jgi:hypothetical protein
MSVWSRGSPCAKPQTLVAGQPGDKLTLQIDFHEGRKHLPIVTLKRAAYPIGLEQRDASVRRLIGILNVVRQDHKPTGPFFAAFCHFLCPFLLVSHVFWGFGGLRCRIPVRFMP